MKAKTKFKRMYFKLPVKARSELAYSSRWDLISLKVCWQEIERDTCKGDCILLDLGFVDD